MFKWKKDLGERQVFEHKGLALIHPLPSRLCSGRAHYCFLHGWAPWGRSNSRYEPISPAMNMVCIQISLKNHIVLFQITVMKKSYILTCPLLPQLFFNLKNWRERDKYIYFIGFREDKRLTTNFLGELRYYQVNCVSLALGVKNALEIQKAKHAFSWLRRKILMPHF